ncbi:hypothetical protein BRC76_04350 [Halobacteriales archaeon QH_8_67_36]|nr:MAG: hypothetical protein BRC76_04350 [Halobacteriales archaeon QH_8_67_36]
MAGRNPSTSTEEVLAVFENNPDKYEPFTAPQMAEQLPTDVHRNTVRNYLQDLASLGELRKRFTTDRISRRCRRQLPRTGPRRRRRPWR